MKIVFKILLFFAVAFHSNAQNAECVLVSYKNLKKNEMGVISFCFDNPNTLMINNYTSDNKNWISSVLLTSAGIEIRESKEEWKKSYQPMEMPKENISEFQNYKVQFAQFTDGNQILKIWFTNNIKFYNSQNYWLFFGALGSQIQGKYSGLFPVALQLSDAKSGNILYEHAVVDKFFIKIQPEVFHSKK